MALEEALGRLRRASGANLAARERLRSALIEAYGAEIEQAWAWRDVLAAKGAAAKEVREMEERSTFLTRRQQDVRRLVDQLLDARRWSRFFG